MATMNEIERKTREYAADRRVLADKVQALEDEIATLKRKHLPGIKRAVDVAAESQAKLYATIETGPELFVKPKTVVLNGIRVGFMKAKGEIAWDSAEQVVKLVKKHFPDQVDVLVKITETPVKSALAQMNAGDLKRIGVTIVETGDQVVIKAADSEVDRLVTALLKEDEVKEAA